MVNQNGYFLEIIFHGLNYHAKRVKIARTKYFVDVHKANVFFLDEPTAGVYRSRVYKRRLIFFSYNKHLLNTLGNKIKAFNLPDKYTGKGLFFRNDRYKIKSGKIRKK